MTNKEYAAQLLVEAAYILNESYNFSNNKDAIKSPIKSSILYLGSPIDLDSDDTGSIYKNSGTIWLTPYKGIASIFIHDDDKLNKGFTTRRFSSNLQYDEWGLPKNKLSRPFDTVHIKLQTDNEYIPQTFSHSGYIYTIDATNLDLLYYKWMNKDLECIVLTKTLPYIKKEKYTVKFICEKDN